VRAAGLIRRGKAPLETEIAADSLVGTLREISDDPQIAAVILRIDSGGGSAVASETIRRALDEVHASGRPVIVSMSNAAASGGYWITAGADRIVAHPATLTGSIGVIAGKPVLEEAWRKLGVSWAEIDRGDNAVIWSLNRPYSEEARARVDDLVGWLYERFIAVVSNGRDLPPDKVREIAKGRVWAGETAQQLGLVDEIGGLHAALAAARRSLQLPPNTVLAVDVWPRVENPLRVVLRSLRPIASRLQLVLGLLEAPLQGTAVSAPVLVR
jgi:protease-4